MFLRESLLPHCGVGIAATLAVSWLQIRPLGLLCVALLALWILKYLSISFKIIPPPELKAKLTVGYQKFVQLRKDRPPVFCGLICAVLIALAVIGHIVSGSCIVVFGLIVAGLISTKYKFEIVKEEWKSLTIDHDVDEFLPEVNETNLFVLQQASTEAMVISPTEQIKEEEEKNEEVPSELLIPDPIPEIDENSEGTSDEDDLLIKTPVLPQNQAIEFKTGYFKKDSSISSSSSDDDSLSKGLNFDAVDSKEKHRLTQSASGASAGSQILPNLVTELFTRSLGITSSDSKNFLVDDKYRKLRSADSSDESEFEILSTDDLNNS